MIAITVLALALLLLYVVVAGGTGFGPRSDLRVYVDVLPYLAPSLFVVAAIVNALFTPNRDV